MSSADNGIEMTIPEEARSFSDRINELQVEVVRQNTLKKLNSLRTQSSGLPPVSRREKQVEESDSDDNGHSAAIQWSDTTTWSLLFIQVVFIILFGVFTKYTDELRGSADTPATDQLTSFTAVYPMFQDVHIMMFIGFGYLMTFLRRYGYSAVGYNFVLAAIAIQWSVLTRNFFEQCWHREFHKFGLDVTTMVNSDFAAATILISFGAVLGKTTLVQLIWMIIVEIVFYSVNEALLVIQFKISDVGGSMIIHTFGAYFGLTVSRMLNKPSELKDAQDDNKPVYHSDIFSMIGTIFLWCYWPSFNGALAGFGANAQPRTSLNTYFSLCASCLVVFAMTKMLRGGKFDMVDVQNATLAGGVAIGASANFMLRPWAAMLIGSFAGFVSSVGFAKLMPYLWKKIGLHDTCGVHNLHGMPGIIGGLASIIATAAIDDADYGENIAAIYPARAENRSHSAQAWFQLAALLATIGMAIVGGFFTGLLLRSRLFNQLDVPFSDANEWVTPAEEIPFFDRSLKHRSPTTSNNLPYPLHHSESTDDDEMAKHRS